MLAASPRPADARTFKCNRFKRFDELRVELLLFASKFRVPVPSSIQMDISPSFLDTLIYAAVFIEKRRLDYLIAVVWTNKRMSISFHGMNSLLPSFRRQRVRHSNLRS